MKALDLFAGCGGASLGLGRAGYEVLGVEFDRQAHATHEAAGMDCILADVRNLNRGATRRPRHRRSRRTHPAHVGAGPMDCGPQARHRVA